MTGRALALPARVRSARSRAAGAAPLLVPALLSAVLLTGCGGESEVAGQTTTEVPVAPSSAAPTVDGSPSSDVEISSEPSPDDAQRVQLTVAGGKVTGDTGRVEVEAGSKVRLTVLSDVADEVHVHGYDRYLDLVAGSPAEVEFVADVPGVFEVELHDAGTLLTRLQVR